MSLAILDFLCDQVHLVYGDEGAYGVVTHTWGTSCNKYISIWISKRREYSLGEKSSFLAQAQNNAQQMNILVTYDIFQEI